MFNKFSKINNFSRFDRLCGSTKAIVTIVVIPTIILYSRHRRRRQERWGIAALFSGWRRSRSLRIKHFINILKCKLLDYF